MTPRYCTACDEPLSAEDEAWMGRYPEPDGDVFCKRCLRDVNRASADLRAISEDQD